MKIGFFLSSFPVFSETFVSNEIIQLQEHIDGAIWFETKNKNSHVQPNVKNIKFPRYKIPTVIFSLENFLTILKPHFYWITNHPLRYLKLIFTFLKNTNLENFKIFLKSPLVAKQLVKEKCNLIYIHESDRSFIYALFVKQLTKIPFGIIFHTYYLFYKNKLLNKKINNASFVIFQSKYSKKYAEKKLKLKRLKKLFVISSPGIDTDYFSPEKNSNISKKKNQLKIISVGRLEEAKGYEYLIKAIYNIKKELPNIELKIIGYGSLEKKLKKLTSNLNLEKNILFLGAIGHNKKFINLLRKAQIFILPSIEDSTGVRDVHPNTVKEAMAVGLITITSKVGGIEEFINNKKNGFLVKQKNTKQLEEVIASISKLSLTKKNKIKANARKTIINLYDKNQVTKNLIRVFYEYKKNIN